MSKTKITILLKDYLCMYDKPICVNYPIHIFAIIGTDDDEQIYESNFTIKPNTSCILSKSYISFTAIKPSTRYYIQKLQVMVDRKLVHEYNDRIEHRLRETWPIKI